MLKAPWTAVWERFRRHVVDLHYDELSQWVAETGIDSDRIFSSQGFNAPGKVIDPFPLRIDSPPKNYDTGGMSVRAGPRESTRLASGARAGAAPVLVSSSISSMYQRVGSCVKPRCLSSSGSSAESPRTT